MELLFLLLPALLLGGLASGGGSDEDDDAPSPAAGNVSTGTSDDDIIDGEGLNDLLLGGTGSDDIVGYAGNDVLVGEFGSDALDGGAGNDVLIGGPGRDVLDGGIGNDLLIGGDFSDLLDGSSGTDVLIGGSGADTLLGGADNDTLFGFDHVQIASALDGAANDLTTMLGVAFGSQVSQSTLDRVGAAVRSGDPSDSSPDELDGGDGSDVLFGDDGDTLSGGAGADDFGVLHFAGDRQVTIEDFDPTTESLTLVLDNPTTATITFEANGVLGTRVLVDGEPTAYVLARTVAELTAGGSPWLLLEQA